MFKDEKGSVSILVAGMIAVILGICAFAVDLANLYTARLKLQRATDMAVVAGASRPDALRNGRVSAEALATIGNVVALNGVDRDTLRVTVEKEGDGSSLLLASASERVPVLFGRILTEHADFGIEARSGARLGEGESGRAPTGECLRSMVGPVNIYGDAQVVGPGCVVGAATYLHLCGSARLEARQVSVKYSESMERPYICGTARLSPPASSFGYNVTSVDPYADDPRIRAIRARFDRMRSPGWPHGHTSPGTVIRRDAPPSVNGIVLRNQSQTRSVLVPYGRLAMQSSTLLMEGGTADPNCLRPTTFREAVEFEGSSTVRLDAGCYVFNDRFSVAAGSDVRIVGERRLPDGRFVPVPITLVFGGSITNRGSLRIGPAEVSIAGSIDNAGGHVLSFGAGTMTLGGSVSNGAGTFEKGDGTFYAKGGSFTNGAGSMRFGDGAFYLWGGSFSNAGTGSVRFGDGPFVFYGGTLYNVSGDMTFGAGSFEFYGGSLSLSRDSRTTFGVGDMNFYGGSVSFGGEKVVFGAGGSAETGGSSIFMSGGSLSLPASSIEAVGTTIAFDGGTISLYGTGRINVTAPRGADPRHGYRDILFVVYGGAFNLYGGGTRPNTMSGLIYVPRTNASIYGSQVVQRPEGGCLQLLAGVVDIYQKAQLDLAACSERRASVATRPVLAR